MNLDLFTFHLAMTWNCKPMSP
uniref:Uncharacterized protein n=1 Tax=Rhizophora mucronata TaxID=61149 RepID=A0A2P2PQM5_RHIMU